MKLLNTLLVWVLLTLVASTLNAQNVIIPDANFKAYLVGDTTINTNRDTEIQVSEATAYNGAINCPNLNIADLTGIEDFLYINSLDCSQNPITSLTLNQYTLSSLDCSNTSLTSLDVIGTYNLGIFKCSNTPLSALDFRNRDHTMIWVFEANNVPNLTCIAVDDVAYSTLYWTNIDQTISYSASCTGPPVVNIPDNSLRNLLLADSTINTNRDSYIQVSEAVAFTGAINCSNSGVEDLTGIGAFVNLTELNCSSNHHLFGMDLRQNVNLITLTTTGCVQLVWMNLSNCILLENLNAAGCDITNLNVSQSPNLINLNCSGSDDMTSLDVSNNTALETLDCSMTEVSTLDLRQNIHLETLICSFGYLNELDIRNGNNAAITTFDAQYNSSLSCISVDNVAYSTANWTNIDAGVLFSANCNGPVVPLVSIPDANFKAYLVGNPAINTNRDSEIQVTEATAFAGAIDCSNLNIADLTGIEAFVNLIELYANTNHLTSLDLSLNTSLITLSCFSNNLASLDVSQNTSITKIYCYDNQIGSLDLSANRGLGLLNASSNALFNLNIKNGQNPIIGTFDVTNNPDLICIQVDDAGYSAANWTNIDATAAFNNVCVVGPPRLYIPDANFKAYLVNSRVNRNGDAAIQISEAVLFTGTIDCRNQNIADLTGIEGFVNLTQLKCAKNNLTSLDVSQNRDLTLLDCSHNPITSLDVTDNSLLRELDCFNTLITSLYLRQNTNLEKLDCHSTQLTDLSVDYNSMLTNLNCSSAQLSSLNVRSGYNGIITRFNATNNPNLSCISVDDIAYSTVNWGNRDAGASFSVNCLNTPMTVSIPDANFKAYLVGNTAINTSGDTEIQVYEAAVFSGTINCSNTNTVDLTGLEAFVSLTGFVCSNNPNTSLDLRSNTSLITFDCSSSSLLSDVNLRNNNNANFLSFDATNCPSLSCITVDNQSYSTTNWTNRDAGTSFDVSCVSLIVNIPDANFKAYLVGNTAINTDGDTEIQVSEAIAFTGRIDCPNQNIADLTGIEAFVNLTQLKCYRNNLTSLDISQNLNLVLLHTANNLITTLDVSQHANLSWLSCSSTNLTSLNVTQNANLTKLYCGATPITSLDLTQNANLTTLDCPNSQLTSIDASQNTSLTVFSCSFSNSVTSVTIKNGNNSNITYFRALGLPNLSCMEVDDTTYSDTTWLQTGANISFSLNCGIPRLAQNSDVNAPMDLVKNAAINLNSLEVLDKPINLSVYPNPTTREITLDFGETYEDVTIEITNLTGHVVKRKTVQNSATANLELEGATGVYFVRIQTETGSATLKLIKA